jgi:1,4-dihydroxy-2-naphthoate octaprenyltransferase
VSDAAPVRAAAEPSPERLANPVLRYFLATRPAFLTITLAGCLLGFAGAVSDGLPFEPLAAAVTLALALLAHAGVNVLNDYYDHLNGTDALNSDRLYPYTGGSRFIQNGVLGPRQTLAFGLLLFAIVIGGGLWLIGRSGGGLFWIGLAGLAIGWAYSAPPLKLNSRGLGEVCVMTGFLLVVAGADYIQRGAFAASPWIVGLSYALLTTNILYINQFPDRRADLAAGKRHWVVRLEPRRAALGYAGILALAALWPLLAVSSGWLTAWGLLALLGLLPAVRAAAELRAHADNPARLRPAIQGSIAAAHLHAVLLAATLLAERVA